MWPGLAELKTLSKKLAAEEKMKNDQAYINGYKSSKVTPVVPYSTNLVMPEITN